MKKLLTLLLLSTSLSTFALDLDFWSSESFCTESPKAQLRNGLYYLPNQQEPFTGENLCVYTNGQYHSKGNLLNGLKDGNWIWWYGENGQKKWERNYKDGNFDGKYTNWYENGQKEQEGNYKDDRLNGKSTWWENGYKKWERNYKDGMKDGKVTQFYQNGQKEVEEIYKDGKADGKMTGWYENGQKSNEGNIKVKKLIGTWTRWDENGQIVMQAFFKDGECISVQIPIGGNC